MKIKGIHASPALVIVICALMAAAGYLDITEISRGVDPYLTVMAMEIACMGLPAVFFCILRGNEYKKRLNIRIIRVRHISLCVYALLLLICAGVSLSLLLYRLFPDAFAASAATAEFTAAVGKNDTFYAALAFGILPAFLEEFLCRGILLTEYTPYGAVTAAVFSSLLFSFLHFSPVRFPIYFVTGLILALVVGATRSVLTAAVVHACYNAFTVYFEKYIYIMAAKQSGGMILLAFMVVTVLLVSAILFFGRCERLYRLMGDANLPSPLRRKRAPGDTPDFLTALLSPTLWLMVVLYLVASFLL